MISGRSEILELGRYFVTRRILPIPAFKIPKKSQSQRERYDQRRGQKPSKSSASDNHKNADALGITKAKAKPTTQSTVAIMVAFRCDFFSWLITRTLTNSAIIIARDLKRADTPIISNGCHVNNGRSGGDYNCMFGRTSKMKRIVILAYGLLAYCAFLATILYAIGFTSDTFVPKGINGGELAPPVQSMLIDMSLVILFGATHSAMARPAFKKRIMEFIPASAERSTYVLVSSLELAILFGLWQPLTFVIWKIDSPVIQYLLNAGSLVGWGIVFWSSFLIDHFDLFGLRQVWLNFRGMAYSPTPFTASGLYKYVRHPLMLGFLVAFWLTPLMTAGHLLFAGGMTVYILIGIALEERDLSKHLAGDYSRYRESTAMILPWRIRR